MTEELLTCPFCGSNQLSYDSNLPCEYRNLNGIFDYRIYGWLECDICFMRGPRIFIDNEDLNLNEYKEKARAAWNERV